MSFCYFLSGHLRGHGTASALGGQGHKTSGGGAGGRIAVHISYLDEYRGALEAIGAGGTSSGDWGGTGTVYVEEIINGTARTRLYLNNQNAVPSKPFILTETNPRVLYEGSDLHSGAPFAFDEVTIQKGVSKKSTFILKQTHRLTYTQHAHILVRIEKKLN